MKDTHPLIIEEDAKASVWSKVKNSKICQIFKNNMSLIMIVIAIVVGFSIGVWLNTLTLSNDAKALIKLPGSLVINMIKSLVVIVIPSSIIMGICSIDLVTMSKIGLRSIVYFLSTSVLSACMGITWVSLIQPGRDMDNNNSTIITPSSNQTQVDTIVRILEDLFPASFVQSAASLNFLGLITFSIALGIALSLMGEKGKPLIKVISVLNEASNIMIKWVIVILPVGICFLVMYYVGTTSGFWDNIQQLGLFVVTVLVGLLFHLLFILPLLYGIFIRRNPYSYMKAIFRAMVTAFGTSSSTATLPINLECVEATGVSSTVTRFMLPLGATISMDGAALYESVAALFVAQSIGREFNFGTFVITCLTATLASIGAPGIPNAGLVTLVIVLTSLDLPLDLIGLLWSVDWLLDRFRTVVNITSDSFGAAIVSHSLGLTKTEEENLENEVNSV